MHIDGVAALAWVLALSFIGIVLFFLLREFWTWYWKQSEQVALLRDIKASLERLEGRGSPAPTP